MCVWGSELLLCTPHFTRVIVALLVSFAETELVSNNRAKQESNKKDVIKSMSVCLNEGVRSEEECSEPNSIRFFLQNLSNLVSSSELGNFLHLTESHCLLYQKQLLRNEVGLVGP